MRPLCVLLHGYPNNSKIWKDQLPVLEREFTVLNLSLPGSETGEIHPEELNLETLIASLTEKIRSTESNHIILIGHDIGAFLLSEVSFELKEKVKAQIFMAGMDFGLFKKRLKTTDQKFRSWYVLLFQAPVLPELIVPKLKKLLSLKLYPATPGLLEEAPHGFTPIGIYRELKKGIIRAGGRKKSAVPTLFLFGEDDPYIGAASQSEINQFYELGQVKTLKAGHWFLRECPQKVNLLIQNFLKI